MPKRRSEEERIVGWFSSADPAAAQTMLNVIKGVLRGKAGQEQVNPKRRGRKSKVADRTGEVTEETRLLMS